MYANPKNNTIGKAGANAIHELGKISSSMRRKRFDKYQDAGRPGSELTPGAGLMKTTDISQFQATPPSENPKESGTEHRPGWDSGTLGDHRIGLPPSGKVGQTPIQSGMLNAREGPTHVPLTRAGVHTNAIGDVHSHGPGVGGVSTSAVDPAEAGDMEKLRKMYASLK